MVKVPGRNGTCKYFFFILTDDINVAQRKSSKLKEKLLQSAGWQP